MVNENRRRGRSGLALKRINHDCTSLDDTRSAAAGRGRGGFDRKRGGRWAGGLTCAAMLGSLILALKVLLAVMQNPGVSEFSTTWLQSDGGLLIQAGMLVDPLSAVMLVLVTFVSLMVQVYSLGYMAGDEGIGRYFAFLSLFTFSMLGLVLANGLIFLYIFWELVGLCSYLLIGFWYKKPEAANAAKKAFIVTRFGDMGFLIGMLVVGYFLNTFNILDLGRLVQSRQTGRGRWPRPWPCCCSAARWAKARSFPCTSGCPTPWKARRRSRP